jgi:hypothetical protein
MACETCGEHLCVKSFDGVKHRWDAGCLELTLDNAGVCADGECGPQMDAGCLDPTLSNNKTKTMIRNDCTCPRLATLMIQGSGDGTVSGTVMIDNQPYSGLVPGPAKGNNSGVMWVANVVVGHNQVVSLTPVYTGSWPSIFHSITF